VSNRVKKRVWIYLLAGLLLISCCVPYLFLSPIGPQFGWHYAGGSLEVAGRVKLKDAWSLTVEESGEVAWILDADGEPLFKGIIDADRPRVHGNSPEYLLRHLPGYELVDATRKGSDDLHALYEAHYRDTATGEIVTIHMVDCYYYSETSPGIITFYSVSDRVGWYEARMMADFLFFF
jgi:hypothetical protein